MFPETKGSGGGADNKSKTIITRSGSTIAFDDNNNAGSITITDPSGNVVILDGNKNTHPFYYPLDIADHR